MNKIWKYNGQEIPFDMSDFEEQERWEQAQEYLKNAEVDDNWSMSKKTKAHCENFEKAMNILFGQSVTDQIIPNKKSLTEWQNAFFSLIDCATAQFTEINDANAKAMQRFENSKRDERRRGLLN